MRYTTRLINTRWLTLSRPRETFLSYCAEALCQSNRIVSDRYGRDTMCLAAEGVEKAWQMRRGNLSPGYTTDWNGVTAVQAR